MQVQKNEYNEIAANANKPCLGNKKHKLEQ